MWPPTSDQICELQLRAILGHTAPRGSVKPDEHAGEVIEYRAKS